MNIMEFFYDKGRKIIISPWVNKEELINDSIEKIFIRLKERNDYVINRDVLMKHPDKVVLVKNLHSKIYINLTKRYSLIGSMNLTVNGTENPLLETLFTLKGQNFLHTVNQYFFYDSIGIQYKSIMGKILKIEQNGKAKIKGVLFRTEVPEMLEFTIDTTNYQRIFERVKEDIDNGKIQTIGEIKERYRRKETKTLKFRVTRWKIVNLSELSDVEEIKVLKGSRPILFFEAEVMEGSQELLPLLKIQEFFVLKDNIKDSIDGIDYDIILKEGALILGHSGVGKTTLIKTILYSLSKRNVNIIVFDNHSVFHSDFTFDVGEFETEEDIDELVEKVMNSLPSSPSTVGARIVVLRGIKNDYEVSREIRELNRKLERIRLKTIDEPYEKRKEMILRYIESLGVPKDFIERYFDFVSLSFKDLTHTAFVRKLNEKLIDRLKMNNSRRHLFVFDEAQIFIPEDAKHKNVSQPYFYLMNFLIKEGRKFGAKVIVATQRMQEISKIVSSIPLKIIFYTDKHPSIRGIEIPTEKGEFVFYYSGKQKRYKIDFSIFDKIEEIVVRKLRELKERGIVFVEDGNVYFKSSRDYSWKDFVKEVEEESGVRLKYFSFEELVSTLLNAVRTSKYKEGSHSRQYRVLIRNPDVISKVF